MGSIPTHCWRSNCVFSFRSILLPHFLYSTTTDTTTTTSRGSISTSKEANSLESLTNWFVSSLGFSHNQALSTSTKLTQLRQSGGATKVCNPNLLRNADLVVSFFHQKGLQKSQIGNVVYSAPHILACRIERNLEPKMKFFQELGLSVSDFARLISFQHGLLWNGLDSTIRPVVEQLRAIIGSNENVVRLINGHCRNVKLEMVSRTLVRNVSALQAQGIPIESIQKHILRLPKSFMRNHENFKEIMAQAETKWGVSPHSSMFLYAVHVLCSLNEKTIESKCQVFESFGWDRTHVVDLFRHNPFLFGLSEENIRDTLNFFMNKLGYDPGYLLAHNTLLGFSLEKRVVPRHLVLQLLKEKGLISGDRSLLSVLMITESRFLERYVRPFEEEVPGLYQMYVDSINSSSQRQTKREKNSPFPGDKLKHA